MPLADPESVDALPSQPLGRRPVSNPLVRTEFFADAVPPCALHPAETVTPNTLGFLQTVEKDHGRIETRRYWQSTDIDWMQDKPLWKNLRSIGMVESIRCVNGENSLERRYYLSSLPLDAPVLARAVRQHWGVENALHWSLDVTFGEDESRARTQNAPQNLATLRRIALNLIKQTPRPKVSQRQRRILAALDSHFLEQLLGI